LKFEYVSKDDNLGNVQISYDVFFSSFGLPPPYDGILTFSANPLLPYTVEQEKLWIKLF